MTTDEFVDAWRQKSARLMYVISRHTLLGEVLRRARAGTLEQDWRERLPAFPYFAALARRGALPDHVVLVERELAGLPVQPWEPYAANGDWRNALDGWYSDTLALETYYETEQFAPKPRPPADPESAVDWLAWYASGQEQQKAADDHARQNQQRRRDGLGASYRAGLAGGGVGIDWLAWYRQRIALWNDLDNEGFRIDARRTDPDRPGWQQWMKQLPEYWTRPLTSDNLLPVELHCGDGY